MTSGGSETSFLAVRGARGRWLPDTIRQPPGLHLMRSMLHGQALEPCLGDLRALSAAQRASPAGPSATGPGERGVTY